MLEKYSREIVEVFVKAVEHCQLKFLCKEYNYHSRIQKNNSPSVDSCGRRGKKNSALLNDYMPFKILDMGTTRHDVWAMLLQI